MTKIYEVKEAAAKRAWIELFWLGAASLALLPVGNALTTDRPLWHSLLQGDWTFAAVELMFWAFAALLASLAVRTARHVPKGRPVPKAKRAPPAAPDRAPVRAAVKASRQPPPPPSGEAGMALRSGGEGAR